VGTHGLRCRDLGQAGLGCPLRSVDFLRPISDLPLRCRRTNVRRSGLTRIFLAFNARLSLLGRCPVGYVARRGRGRALRRLSCTCGGLGPVDVTRPRVLCRGSAGRGSLGRSRGSRPAWACNFGIDVAPELWRVGNWRGRARRASVLRRCRPSGFRRLAAIRARRLSLGRPGSWSLGRSWCFGVAPIVQFRIDVTAELWHLSQRRERARRQRSIPRRRSGGPCGGWRRRLRRVPAEFVQIVAVQP
jgi:hypothetical protein